MKRAIRLAVALISLTALLIIGSVSVHAADDYGYNADKAISYANKHYTDKKAYDGGSLDCVKFVKKSVEAGGVPVEKGRDNGYTPAAYVKYIRDNGWADYYELELSPHDWSIKQGKVRYYVDLEKNAGKISAGDILVYKCNKLKCPKTTFHLELVHDIEGEVTSYAHNTNKGPSLGNDNVITFPHGKCKSNGATDENTEIWVLHFKDDPALFCDHSYATKSVEAKATFGTAGSRTLACSKCGKTVNKTIAAVKTPTLSATKYTYNTKTKSPSVTVKDSSNKKLTKVASSTKNGFMTKYDSGRKSVGTYKVTVNLTGSQYEGTKDLYFDIVPKGVSIYKLSPSKKAFTVKWKKPSSTYRKQMTGYQIRYSTSSSKLSKATPVTYKSTSGTSKKISKLSSKKTYYVQLRTYKSIDGERYYSSWSSKKKVKTK